MPSVRVVNRGRIIDEVFEGQREGDDSEKVEDGGDSAGRRG